MSSPVTRLVAVGALAGALTVPALAPAHATSLHARQAPAPRVLAISLDGFNPKALAKLGKAKTPNLHRIIKEGATTLNARTERERTETLPNHTGMVTGRRIDKRHGGHGVVWNDDRRRPPTVQAAAGHRVESVFSTVMQQGGSSAMFAAKTKFSLFERSWPASLDKAVIDANNYRLVDSAIADLKGHDRDFTFLHLSLPDAAGHKYGFMSEQYLQAVENTDDLVGEVLAAVDNTRKLKRSLRIIVTADHGGKGANHYHPTKLVNYRIPFMVWGKGVKKGASLYGLNPDYKRPGKTRTDYKGKQPIRNGMVANLALDILGMPKVAHSQFDKSQNLDWR